MRLFKKIIQWVRGLFTKKKVPKKPNLVCGECGVRGAVVLVTFCSKTNPVIDYPVCKECMENSITPKYKAEWNGTQICIKSA